MWVRKQVKISSRVINKYIIVHGMVKALSNYSHYCLDKSRTHEGSPALRKHAR